LSEPFQSVGGWTDLAAFDVGLRRLHPPGKLQL
jgi:hypothetical protein